METFMSEILSGQSFVVIILVGAVVALWRSTQEQNKKIVEIIENNTKAQQELRHSIERTASTTDDAFKLIYSGILEHNRQIMDKLDLIIKINSIKK